MFAEVTSRSPYLPAAIGLIVIILGSLALWITVHGAPRAPRVLRFTRLTNDGQAKPGPMVTDGSRIYFNESLPGLRSLIVQVPPRVESPSPSHCPSNILKYSIYQKTEANSWWRMQTNRRSISFGSNRLKEDLRAVWGRPSGECPVRCRWKQHHLQQRRCRLFSESRWFLH